MGDYEILPHPGMSGPKAAIEYACALRAAFPRYDDRTFRWTSFGMLC